MTDRPAILVVEDEPMILLDIVFHLQAEGYKVYDAVNADVAIRLLQSHADIGVIFTDIDMPGSMDGLKLAIAVRDRWPPVRIIVTSGRPLPDLNDLPAGSLFISKPYHNDVIMHMIRTQPSH